MPIPLLLLGFAVLMMASKTDGGKRVMAEIQEGMQWLDEAIRRSMELVSSHEGQYDSLNLNRDNAGLSMGILQWPQRTGGLGLLLAQMHHRDPKRLRELLGPAYETVLQVTAKKLLVPVEGKQLWQEPWIQRFRALGREPVFQQVQRELAQKGEWMEAALDATRSMGVWTERALVLTYDTSVQQGPGFVRQTALKVRQEFAQKTVPGTVILSRFAELASAHFRRNTRPASLQYNKSLVWKEVGAEWHVFAGSIDLYEDISRRKRKILSDATLKDDIIDAMKHV